MAESAKTSTVTNLFAEPSIEASLLTRISSETNVAVIEHGSLWSKIILNEFEGFCETKNLSFENSGDNTEDAIMISLPKDCACALYNALKFSLQT